MLNVGAPSTCITDRSKTRCIIQRSVVTSAKLYFRDTLSHIVMMLRREGDENRARTRRNKLMTDCSRERSKFIFDQKQWPIIHLSAHIPRARAREIIYARLLRAHEMGKKLDVVIFGISYGTETTSCAKFD